MQVLSTIWSVISKRRSTAFSFWVIGVLLPIILVFAALALTDVGGPRLFDLIPFFAALVLVTAAYTWRNVGKLFYGLALVLAQGLIQTTFLALFLALFLYLAVFQVVAPHVEVNDPRQQALFEERLSTRYGIEIDEDAVVEYFSVWSIGAEAGINLILTVKAFDPIDYAPNGAEFRAGVQADFLDQYADWPFCGAGAEHIAGFRIAQDLEIEDPEIRALVCGLATHPLPILSAFYQAGYHWRITTVFFPDNDLVWINDTNW